jgi:type-F conjugative transfer system secretin TraK
MYIHSEKSTRASSFSKLLAVAVIGCASLLAHAEQRITGADRKQVEVAVSAKEHNDISIAGGVVSKIRVVKGKIDYKRDSNGVLSFVLTSDEPQTVSLTVIDEEANRYNLMLVPKPIPQQDIVLVPTPSGVAVSTGVSGQSNAPQTTTSYQRRLKQFAVAVIDQTTHASAPSMGFSRQTVNELIPLWKEASLRYLNRFIDGDLVAEQYELTNVSKDMLNVVEPELMRSGVVSIFLSKQSLAPSEVATLIVFRGRNGNE